MGTPSNKPFKTTPYHSLPTQTLSYTVDLVAVHPPRTNNTALVLASLLNSL